MELWIRSQNKTILSKAHDLVIREDRNENNEINYFIVDTYTLGIYKTKERALEVLDEIQNILKPQMILSKIGTPIAETCDGTVYREQDEYDIKEISTYVYEMPKE
jgi:hypothetical protein